MSFFAGIWSGSFKFRGDSKSHYVMWSLTLSPDAPTAFGASYDPNNTKELPKLLIGQWNASEKTLKITVKDINPNMPHVDYNGFLTVLSSGDVMLQLVSTNLPEQFEHQLVLRMEPFDNNVHLSGSWLGICEPAPELADFGLPSNPIRWSMSALFNIGYVFGAGFFDDSADVPDKPLLFFILHGTCSLQNKTLHFFKEYEVTTETQGVRVEYNATVSAPYELRGRWENASSGGRGDFACWLEPPSLPTSTTSTPHLVQCANCTGLLPPGRPRMVCERAECQHVVCVRCMPMGLTKKEHKSEHNLQPLLTFRLPSLPLSKSCAELIRNALSSFGDRIFLKYKTNETIVDSKKTYSFELISYEKTGFFVCRLATAIRLITSQTIETLEFKLKNKNDKIQLPIALIVADNSAIASISLLSTLTSGFCVAHISSSLSNDSICSVFQKCNPTIVFCEEKHCSLIDSKTNANCPIVILDDFPHDFNDFSPDQTQPTHRLSDLLMCNSASSLGDFPLLQNIDENTISGIFFTSGSSSNVPKGALFTEALMLPTSVSSVVQPAIQLDFAPFDATHLLTLLSTIQVAGTRCYAPLDAACQVKPRHMGAPPSVWHSFKQQFDFQVAQEMQSFDEAAVSHETKRAQKQKSVEKSASEAIRQRLGGWLAVATSGGAALRPDVAEFVRKHLQLQLVELYGSRETGGIARDGIVYPGIDIELLPVVDEPSENRGEICVFSPRLIDGYLGEQNNTSFVQLNGKQYYKTGDVGEWYIHENDNTRRLRVIGRVSNLVKTRQGTWLQPLSIELVIEQLSYVSSAVVFVDSFGAISCVLRVENVEMSVSDVLSDIRMICCHHQIKSTEIPQKALLTDDEWRVDNGLLTCTGKLNRRALFHKYNAQFDNAKIDQSTPHERVYPQWLMDALSSVLLDAETVDFERTLAENGGDSIAALHFSANLREKGIFVSVEQIFRYSLKHIFELCVSRKFDFHSNYQKTIDWKNESIFPKLKQFDNIKIDENFGYFLNKSNLKPEKIVFLTGGTGLVGRHVIKQLIKSEKSIDLICLVRETKENALHRLMSSLKRAFGTDDVAPFLSKCTLRAVAGDVAQDRLGLPEPFYAFLAHNVTDIVHCAAHVNHAMPFEQLKNTNCVGTINVLELASKRTCTLHCMSSVGVLPAGQLPLEERLNLDVASLNIKNGYSQSKVVAELLCQNAQQQFSSSFRLVVYRPGALCGDRLSCDVPTDDVGALLVAAAVQLKARPRNASLQLCWTPVDDVALCVQQAMFTDDERDYVALHCVAGGSPTVDELLTAVDKKFPLEEKSIDQFQQLLTTLPKDHVSYRLNALKLSFQSKNQASNSIVDCSNSKSLLKEFPSFLTPVSVQLVDSFVQRWMDMKWISQ